VVLTTVGAFGTLAIPSLSQNLINEGIGCNNLGIVLTYCGYMVILTLIVAACQIINTSIAVKFSEPTDHYLRISGYQHIQELSFGSIDQMRPEDLLVHLTNDIQNVKIAISVVLPSLERIYELLDTPADVNDPMNPVAADQSKIKGEVGFEKVSFGYRNPDCTQGQPVLRGISITAKS
jgi:ABC-type multidrug transport system fused ATPase/permease subunit